MAADVILANRVRTALAGEGVPFEEKRMFGGIAFLVRGKMTVAVGRERLMCRIDPDVHNTALQHTGCRTVVMKGREYRGYVHVDLDNLKRERELKYWLDLALVFNRRLVTAKSKRSR